MKVINRKSRFFHGKKPHSLWKSVAGAFVFLAAVFLFSQGLNQLSVKTGQEQKKNLEEAVWRGITQCYAIEGRYPESLEYLKEEYGVQYDSDRFFVDYQALGSNLVPDVTIIEK